MKASCIGPSQPVDLEEKVIRFLTDRDNDAVTGVRRVSRDDTVDMVVDIGRGLGIIISIYPEIEPDSDIVVFRHWQGMDEIANHLLDSDPSLDIIFGQDLCHQVPAVVRFRR